MQMNLRGKRNCKKILPILTFTFASHLPGCGSNWIPQPSPTSIVHPNVTSNADTPVFIIVKNPCSKEKALRVSDGIIAPVLLKKTDPIFPDEMKDHHFTGSMYLIEVVITRDGEVCGMEIVKSPVIDPPWPEGDRAVLDAVSKWRFKPAILEGFPVDSIMTLSISIHLR